MVHRIGIVWAVVLLCAGCGKSDERPQVAALLQALSSLDERVATLEAQELDARLTDAEAQLAAYVTATSANSDAIALNSTAISGNADDLATLEAQFDMTSDDVAALETAVADLEGSIEEMPVWLDATGALVGQASFPSGAFDSVFGYFHMVVHVDTEGYAWPVAVDDMKSGYDVVPGRIVPGAVVGEMTPTTPTVVRVHTVGSCGGTAYVPLSHPGSGHFAAGGREVIAAPPARFPFYLAGDAALHVLPDEPTVQNLTVASYTSDGSTCFAASFTADLVPLSETVPGTPIAQPPDFVPPLRLQSQ